MDYSVYICMEKKINEEERKNLYRYKFSDECKEG